MIVGIVVDHMDCIRETNHNRISMVKADSHSPEKGLELELVTSNPAQTGLPAWK